MTKEDWKKLLVEQMKIDENYIPSFETSVNILSEILFERDRVYSRYLEEGAQPVVIFETDRGAKNLKPNPLLRQWQDLNTTALQYLRDLGLTAAGLRKLQGQIPKGHGKGPDPMEEMRRHFGLDKFTMPSSSIDTSKTGSKKRGKKVS